VEELRGDLFYKDTVVQSRGVDLECRQAEILELTRKVRVLEGQLENKQSASTVTAGPDAELRHACYSGVLSLRDNVNVNMKSLAERLFATMRKLESRLDKANYRLGTATDALESRQAAGSVQTGPGSGRGGSYETPGKGLQRLSYSHGGVGALSTPSPARTARAEARMDQLSSQLSQAIQEKEDLQASVSGRASVERLWMRWDRG